MNKDFVSIEEMTAKIIDEEVNKTPNLIDMYLRHITKQRDELIYSLFEKCGYPREEVLDLIKAGVITGTRASSVVYPDMEWYSFSAHGETLFTMCEKFDPENCTMRLGFQKVKGDSDE